MYNKKLLSKIDLGKYNKPNPYSKDIIVDPQGQYNHPGVPTRIPSNDITMKGVGYPVLGIADNGQKQMMQPGQDYKFPGAKYVDEYPQMKKGGGLNSKKYTRSLEGIGELFRESTLFKKPKSKKKKFFHPNAKYYQEGGDTDPKPQLTPEQKEYLRIKHAEAKKVYMAAKAGDPNAKKLAAEFKNKYPNESWTCPSDNCPAPTKPQPAATQPKVNQYPTTYKPVVNNVPKVAPEGKAIVGYNEVQQLDPKTGVVTTVKDPIYEDLEKPMPTLRPTKVDPRLIEFVGNPESETETDELSEYATPDNGAEWVGDTERYIDWDGNSVGYNLPRVRKPGHGGDLIRKGKRRYLHFPSIESRYQAEIVPEEEQYAVGGAATPKDLDPETMRRYLAALKDQENSIQKGYKNGMWYPHRSVEGGADTIAYGHKLTSNAGPYYKGITDKQAEVLLQADVLKNQAIAKKQIDKKYGAGTFDNLPQDRQMLLVDYQYNLGTLSGFPSFVDATVKGDKDKMIKEHVRFGAGKPLKKRNDWTMGVINEMSMPKPYDPNTVQVPIANIPDATQVVNPVDPSVMPAPLPVVAPPPPQFQGGGVVELDGYQFVKNPNGQFTYFDPVRNTTGAPVTDKALMQRLQYEAKPVGTKPVVQEAPGRQKAKETVINASKNVKPQPIERNIPRANVADATSVTQPYIQKPTFLDQPSPAKSLADSQKLLQDEAQRLITSGAAKDMGITAKYLSPQNANSANPKSLQQLMIEEMTKKDFQKRLDQSRLNKVNKKWNESSTLGKVGDVTRSFLADPINVAEEAIWGDQYLPDRANILRDPRNPLNPYYRKETGYDQSPINNMVNMINPFSSAADATVYARQGNLLGTATQFGEGLLKAAVLTRAPGALNALMSRRVGLGALGATDVGTIAGGVGVGTGTLALPTTAEALYKAGRTGKKEDIRAAVNQTLLNATDFIAPEVLGSKGALSAILKEGRLTPLQQLSRQNILTGSTANNLNDLRLSTPALDQAVDMSRNLRSYAETFAREQGSAPVFASLQDDTQYQLMDLYDQRRAVDRTLQDLRNQGATNSPYFQGAINERDYLTRQIDNLNTQTRDRIAAIRQSALSNPIDNANIPRQPISNVNLQARRNEVNDLTRRLRNESGKDSAFYRAAVVEKSRINSKIEARRDYMRASFSSIEAEMSQNAARIAEARNKLQVAEENLKINDPDYYQQLVPPTQPTVTGLIDLRRPTPGVTEYTGSNLPAPVTTSQVYGEIGNQLGNPNLAPVDFSEATREALRQRNTGSLLTLEARLRTADNPIDFVNRLRNEFANGYINRQTYDELVGGLKNVVKPKSDAYEDFDFFEEIVRADPNKPYTGSSLSGNEVLNELKSIPKEELEDVLRNNYGYGADDYSFIFNNTGISDEMAKVAMNQILDDYTFAAKYNITNPHSPAIDFFSRQTLAPQLKSNSNDLGLLNLSPKTVDIIEKTKYGNRSQTTGKIRYDRTDIDYNDLPTINDKKYILNNNELDEQLQAYEEAYSKMPKGSANPVHKDIQNRLEDLRSTKWLRTEYAAELKAAGLKPSEIENITVISSQTDNSKSFVNKDGKVIATLDFSQNSADGKLFSQISQTGVPQIFHSYNLKASGFKNWDEAQDALTKRYISEGLNKTIAKNKAATKIAFLQVNNNNKIGEALYRGVHHGIKDTRGGIGTKQLFAQTDLADPVTKNIVSRYRAKDYWNSQMKQINEKGIGKAGYDPNITNSPIFVLRKKGGDVSKLSRFIG